MAMAVGGPDEVLLDDDLGALAGRCRAATAVPRAGVDLVL
jgi:hypothetical protein